MSFSPKALYLPDWTAVPWQSSRRAIRHTEILRATLPWLSRKARVPILALGVVFHLGTLVLMNIFFPYHLALYLVFVDWPALARWSGARLHASRGAAASGGGPAS